MHAFQYDAENHLVSTAGVNYTYDGDGKRVMKSNGTIYWYGTSSDAYMETDLSNNMKFQYYFFNGQRVARSNGSNQVNWYFADHLGSSRVVWSTTAATTPTTTPSAANASSPPAPATNTNSPAKNATPSPAWTTSAPATTPPPSAAS